VTCVHHPRRAWTLVVKQMIDRFAFGSLDPTACACAVVRPVYAPVRDRVYSQFRLFCERCETTVTRMWPNSIILVESQ
jgi:hypothetical protein